MADQQTHTDTCIVMAQAGSHSPCWHVCTCRSVACLTANTEQPTCGLVTAQGAQWSGLMIAAVFMRSREGAASQFQEHTAGMVHQTT